MFDLRLRYDGNGVFRVATKEDARITAQHVEVGEQIKAHCTKRFTATQSALFHAMCKIAFEHQITTEPQFGSWEQLKVWIKVKAGHARRQEFPEGLSDDVASYLLRNVDGLVVNRRKGGGLVLYIARSLTELNKDDMAELIDRSKLIIEQHIIPGVDLDQLMETARQKIKAVA